MTKLRSLSGKDLLRIFSAFGFSPFSQRGSHIKLRRTMESGVHQTLTIVSHSEVDRGTNATCNLSPSEALTGGIRIAALLLHRLGPRIDVI